MHCVTLLRLVQLDKIYLVRILAKFKLLDKSGKPFLMKNGEPFIYTTKQTAQMGKKFLEAERKTVLKVVPA